MKLTLCIDLKKDELERNATINEQEILLAEKNHAIVSREIQCNKLLIVYENNMSPKETRENKLRLEEESLKKYLKGFFAVLGFCIILAIIFGMLNKII